MDIDEIKNDPLKFINELYRNQKINPTSLSHLKSLMGAKNSIVMFARQQGKTTLNQQLYAAWIDNIRETQDVFEMKFNLRSGIFMFYYFFRSKTCELTKVSSGSKWSASNRDYILKFLLRRGTKEEDIYTLERLFFEES